MKTRITEEKETVEQMIKLYCRYKEGHAVLCDSCMALLQYAHTRLSRCPFGEKKSTCRRCKVHCYKQEMKQRMREVMRYAGPRMLWHHPFAAIRHLWRELL